MPQLRSLTSHLKYTDAIAKSKFDQRDYADQRQEYADKRSDAEAQAEIDQQNALAKIQEQQTAQDKFLTSSTGKVYLNGEMMLDAKGKPMTTVDMMKLQETNRHNTTNEDLAKQKLSVSQQKMNNDLAIATQKLQFNWASLDLKSATASANIANAQAKLEVAARNGDTAEIKAQATVLNNQLKNIQTQINGYKKADKPVPAKLKSQLKSIMTKMSTLANMGK
jgi:hypothetical protein